MIDREQMIQELKDRLQWMEHDAPEEEYNIKEIAAIKRLLKVLEPAELNFEEEYFSDEEAMKRFWSAYDSHMAIDQEKLRLLLGKVSLADAPAKEKQVLNAGEIQGRRIGKGNYKGMKSNSKRNKVFAYFARHKLATASVIAVVVIVTFFAGGTAGAYAQSRMGWFQFLERDEEGLKAVYEPNNAIAESDKDIVKSAPFCSVEDLPKEFREIFCLPDTLNGKYDIQSIETTEKKVCVIFRVIYHAQNSEEYIEFVQRHYNDKITYFRSAFDTFVFDENKTIRNVKVEFYRSDSNDDKEYIARFFTEKDLFVIQSNLKENQFKRLVKEVIDSIVP